MSQVLGDVKFALRMLRKGWGVTLVAVLSLAVAIGGNTAVFGLISAVLFRPSSVVEPERVVLLQERRQDQSPNLGTLASSLGTFQDLQERSRTTAAWAAFRPTVLGLRGPERSEPVTSAQVTVGFFDLIGVRPARGRAFLAAEGVEGGARVAVVRPEFWERERGGGDPVGEVLPLNGEPYEVVGVLPSGFSFLFTNADIWIPLTDNPTASPRDRRDIVAMARLAPGASMEQFQDEVAGLTTRLRDEHPETFGEWTLDVFNLRRDIPNTQTKVFYALLQGSVFFVLLIACVNITNLLLARGQERAKEIALRTALGAGRWRIVRQLLTESSVLVLGGSVLGLALGWYGIGAMARTFQAVLPAGFTPTLDGSVLLFTVAVAAVAGLLFGVVPAVQTFRSGQVDALKEGGGKSSQSRGRKLLSRSLVVAEIALSLVALGGGGMLMRSFLELQNADPGFEPGPIMTAQIRVPTSRYPDAEQARDLHERLLAGARALSGVEAAALTNVLPQSFGVPTDTFHVRGSAADAGDRAPRAFSLRVSPGYLATFEVELLQGRFFEDADRLDGAPVVVVNRSLAEARFPGVSPVGRTLAFRGETREIVGVVEDVRQVLLQTGGQVRSEAVYMPAAQAPEGNYFVVLRSRDDPAALAEPLRGLVQNLDPDLTLNQVLTMEAVMEQAFVGVRVFNVILGGFGILAILLAAVGTYGVLAHSVNQRRQEIGVRMAVGAEAGTLVRMITRQGVVLAAVGLTLGGLLMVPLTGLLRSLMDGISTVSADTPVWVALILFLVTLAASSVPAWRAADVDPVTALRGD